MPSTPSTPPPSEPVRRALSISVVEGSLHAVMLGVSETYLGAFAVELGHGAERLALLATLPLALGALAQLSSGALTRVLGRKRLAVIGALCQAVCHLGLIGIAASADDRLAPLLGVKILFWISGSIMAPAWGDWIAALTEGVSRERYFARRSAIVHLCLVVAFAAAGVGLYMTAGNELSTYAVLFAVGAAARLASALALALQDDPSPPAAPMASPLTRTRAALREGRFRVVGYLGLLMFGASVSIPFFTPYMLTELELDYGTFAALSGVSILSKALVFPLFRRIARALGLPRLLLLSGVGVASVPLLWTLSPELGPLVIVHIVSGVAWAGLEFSSFQILMAEIRPELRTEFFSLNNSFSGMLQVAGSVGGGWLLREGGLAYVDVFLVSAVLRVLPLFLLLRALPRMRLPKRLLRIPMRLFSVRPSAGAAQRPILSRNPAPPDEE